ncbi:hypothetical protein SBRCBS47491_009871 [Sporothrix bragantina]|uniref:Xylanolytic transcriptional activator regulatory domain-containing protein n=1 Tax=Sporothrix bragantina TaxID=671064 RepID=A0ABP0CYC7_9PEZI
MHVNDAPERSLLFPDTANHTRTTSSESQHRPEPAYLRPEGFIAPNSVLSYDELTGGTAVGRVATPDSSNFRQAILRTTQAAVLPEPALARALLDAFKKHMLHLYPVVEEGDLAPAGSSVLLTQALCLAGSLTRHNANDAGLSHLLYEKVKILLMINYEDDHVQTLKALCLMSCWSAKAPDQISVDGPWHWTGIATRLAIQMGLHKESTYTRRANASCLRRIFWHLVNGDRLQVACWGRPSLLRSKDLDVRMLSTEDFPTDDLQAHVFLQNTKLCTILDAISDISTDKRPARPEEVSSITSRLCDWVVRLPPELRLFDTASERRGFDRPTSEMFIEYFVAIILAQNLMHKARDKPWRTSIMSIVAASCAVSLYEEIHYREQAVCLTPIHGFFCMASALPLLYYRPTVAHREASRVKQIDILRQIMTTMSGRYGGAGMVMRKMNAVQRNLTRAACHEDDQAVFYATPQQQPPERAHELFPFPLTFCDDLSLLELTATSYDQFVATDLVPFENELDGVFRFDGYYPLMNVLDMDFGALDSSNLAQPLDTAIQV